MAVAIYYSQNPNSNSVLDNYVKLFDEGNDFLFSNFDTSPIIRSKKWYVGKGANDKNAHLVITPVYTKMEDLRGVQDDFFKAVTITHGEKESACALAQVKDANNKILLCDKAFAFEVGDLVGVCVNGVNINGYGLVAEIKNNEIILDIVSGLPSNESVILAKAVCLGDTLNGREEITISAKISPALTNACNGLLGVFISGVWEV